MVLVADVELTLSNDFTYLLFIGAGRTGSSAVGQMLNAHPNICVSNETRHVRKCIENDLEICDTIDIVIQAAINDLCTGVEKYSISDSQSLSRRKKIQRGWVDMGSHFESAGLKKELIQYVGDKKQGGNSRVFFEHPYIFMEKFANVRWRPISIVRRPSQIMLSSFNCIPDAKLRDPHDTKSLKLLDEICKKFMSEMVASFAICELSNNPLILCYEDLMNDSYGFARNIEESLKLKHNDKWCNLVSNTTTKFEDRIPTNKQLNVLVSNPGFESFYQRLKKYGIVDEYVEKYIKEFPR